MKNILIHKRGQVWYYKDNISDKNSGLSGVQRGSRPVLIISNDIGNESNDAITIVKISSKQEKANLSINVPFYNDHGNKNVILCNQVEVVNKANLSGYMYTLSDDIMKRVEKAIRESLGMPIVEIDDKIDEIYKMIENLQVLKANNLHNNADKDKKVDELLSDIRGIYTKLMDYHNSTLAEMKSMVSSFSDANAKLRMGISNIGLKKESQSSVSTNAQHKSNDNTKPKKRRKYGYWTQERVSEFLEDKEKLSVDELIEKYEFTDRKQMMATFYRFKYEQRK